MSQTLVTLERINEVEHHPNADRLDIVQVLGYKVVVGRDELKVGNTVVYFPVDILIPQSEAERFGVDKYLKHAIYPGDIDKTRCRVAAARLRGIPSHGFAVKVAGGEKFGTDVTDRYRGVKYEPPKRIGAGDAAPDVPSFHEYTSIENIQRYPDAILEGTEVVITEKIHGTNSRIGLVKGSFGWEFMAGSHKVRRKMIDSAGGKSSLYWEPLGINLMGLLVDLGRGKYEVIVFAEIFGQGVQDMCYAQQGKAYRIFDISIDGKYMNWDDVVALADNYNLKTAPELYRGPFSAEVAEEFTYGPTALAKPEHIKSKFKDREGVVIKPLIEAHSDVLGGRMILKSKSVDYLNRRDAQDIE